MPRQARVIVPGFPHNIVQRGQNSQPVFRLPRCTDISTLGHASGQGVFWQSQLWFLGENTQKTPDHELAKARDRKKNLV
ncbi:hypothetical protein SAMN04488490_3989 [Marinobacter sp. LV10R510-11A]|nr:hypothetical protein SAMN04488490_3989 [Marinobacter sp. LV10R510-11A]